MLFKALRGSPKIKAQRGQYLLAVGLGRYKWYQSQVPDARPQRVVDLGAVPHRLEEGKSANEDVGPRRGVNCDVPRWLGRRTNHLYKG